MVKTNEKDVQITQQDINERMQRRAKRHQRRVKKIKKKNKKSIVKRVAVDQFKSRESLADVRKRLNLALKLPENYRIPFKKVVMVDNDSITGGRCCDPTTMDQQPKATLKDQTILTSSERLKESNNSKRR